MRTTATFVRTICLSAALILLGCGSPAHDSKSKPPRIKPAGSANQSEAHRKTVDSSPGDEVEIATLTPEEDEPVPPPSKFRPADRRPVHDDAQLAAAGIQRYESQRLILYTDIDPEIAQTLPPVVDQLYDALVAYFGPLPPDERGTEYQLTGYLIRDEAPFRAQKLLDGVPTLLHGKHLANRFWLRDQQDDYYRRHLLLHECTHCFMTCLPGPLPPVWYMEGMAELFGTHRLNADGRAEFRILPAATDRVEGWGRISLVQQECADGKPLTIRGVYDLPHEAFFQPRAYAWSWALCQFLDSHPRYAARFRALGRHLQDGEFPKAFHEAFAHEERNASTEWTLFEFQLQPGYDAVRAAIDFQPLKPLADGESRRAAIQAARGWQDVGLEAEEGQVFEIQATGRFSLAGEPKPWISEPQGISIRYFDGRPLGRLLACLDANPAGGEAAAPPALQIEPIGKSARLTMPANGRLLLRLNDAWDSLSDNEGSVDVTIRRISAEPESQ